MWRIDWSTSFHSGDAFDVYQQIEETEKEDPARVHMFQGDNPATSEAYEHFTTRMLHPREI